MNYSKGFFILFAVVVRYLTERDRALFLSLAAVALLTYLPFVNNPFFFDDLGFLFGAPVAAYASSGFSFNLRWIAYATLGWTWAFFFEDPAPYRIGNVLLHIATGWLLFVWFRQIGKFAELNLRWVRFKAWSFTAAMVFVAHPVASFAVGYVVQRSIVMATMFSLITYIAYTQALLSGQRKWLVVVTIAFFCAIFSKEHSVSSLGVLAALTMVFRDRKLLAGNALAVVWIFLIAEAVLITLLSAGILGTPYEMFAQSMFDRRGLEGLSNVELQLFSILTQAGLFFKYLLTWVFPYPGYLSIDMRVEFLAGAGLISQWLPLLLFLVVFGIGAVLLLSRTMYYRLLGLAIVSPAALFVVEFSTIRVQEAFVLYRSYAWIPPALLAIPVLCGRVSSQNLFKAALPIALCILVPLTWHRLWIFQDDYRLWTDAIEVLPDPYAIGAERIYYNRGNALMKMKLWSAAIKDYETASRIRPGIAEIHMNLGYARAGLKQYHVALAEFAKVTQLVPENGHAYFNQGMVFNWIGNAAQAKEKMRLGCRLNYKPACVVLAQVEKAH